MRPYPYAVMNHNHPNDKRQMPHSVHRTREAAMREADKQNRSPNAHYRAVQWGAGVYDREFPSSPVDA